MLHLSVTIDAAVSISRFDLPPLSDAQIVQGCIAFQGTAAMSKERRLLCWGAWASFEKSRACFRTTLDMLVRSVALKRSAALRTAEEQTISS